MIGYLYYGFWQNQVDLYKILCMRTKLKLAAIVILSFLILSNCKKSKSSSPDAGIGGMRTWQEMLVNGTVDSTGVRHYDTSYLTIRTEVKPISGSEVAMYFDSGAVYPDTLKSVPSNVSGIVSFTKTRVDSNTYFSNTIIDIRYDSVAYNYGTNSIYWYNLTSEEQNGVTDSSYYISHTP